MTDIDNLPLPLMPEPGPVPLPAGIAQLADPCWHLLDAEGTPFLDVTDTVQHHPTEGDARGQAQTVNEQHDNDDEPVETLTVVQLPEACWTATAACGRELRDDENTFVHADAAEDALSRAADLEWTVRDGVLRCWEHGQWCEVRP